ncbi:hypothetical protein VPH35_123205 [Triticum aestivum]
MLSVCVPERGCGEGLHGVEVGEEERHGEGGGEHDERQEEPAVARQGEGDVLPRATARGCRSGAVDGHRGRTGEGRKNDVVTFFDVCHFVSLPCVSCFDLGVLWFVHIITTFSSD